MLCSNVSSTCWLVVVLNLGCNARIIFFLRNSVLESLIKKKKKKKVCTQFDRKGDLNLPINYNDYEDLFLDYKNNLLQMMLKL